MPVGKTGGWENSHGVGGGATLLVGLEGQV